MPTPIAPSVFGPPQPAEFNPEDILESLRIDAMVASYADKGAAEAYVQQMRPHVMAIHDLLPQLRSGNATTSGNAIRRAFDIMKNAGMKDGQIYAFLNSQQVSDGALRHARLDPEVVNPEKQIKALIPAITGGDKAAATTALRRALTMLRDYRGYKGPEPFYNWLAKNVKDDDVLRGAGIDPEEMRRATAPGDPHPDVAALLDIARTMLGAMIRQNPALGDADAAQAAAAFQRFSGTSVSLPTAGAATAGLTVRDLLALPIRA